MIWIPIAFLCTQLGCTMVSGQPEYSDKECTAALSVASKQLDANPAVIKYFLSCVAVNPT